jgi:hypothetical protein
MPMIQALVSSNVVSTLHALLTVRCNTAGADIILVDIIGILFENPDAAFIGTVCTWLIGLFGRGRVVAVGFRSHSDGC